ncbi:MAG: 3-methyl-2-oxobutanoate hydroxymethyltransferase, partial [Lentisphaeria bacterium]|nr:3-methyl-2-oxobutanoate hydroxymethyltransferase [Lentisphaeria bacterium]
MTKKKTVRTFRKMKKNAEKIVMITAYDAPTAAIAQAADIDLILIGDSVGTTMLGYDDTVPVTMDDMIHHCKQVRRGAPDMFLVGDMPFLSYHCGDDDAMRNAGRFLQEAACDCVKLESSRDTLPLIKRMVAAGIPVMAHIGLLPQHVKTSGGYRIAGREEADAAELKQLALDMEKAGAFALVLECVPAALSAEISRALEIPVIGIGAGAGCDGQ